jgi:transposase
VRDRIKAVLLADDGWTYRNISYALFIDEQTISQHVVDYKESGKLTLSSGGKASYLTEAKSKELTAHLKETLYTQASEICEYVQTKYGVYYTLSGMTSWLKANRFVYKQPKGVPAKANVELQKKHIESYENHMNTTPEDEPTLFVDSMHPTQSSKLADG